jgi:2-polyprenyl-3-methyl-5-hydroxy-6-metoxy-1,4-benzoquinol methylase
MLPEIATDLIATCPVCGADNPLPFAEGFDYELETSRNRWRFDRCPRCDHLWLNPRPAVETLATIYPAHYYAYQFAAKVHPLAVRGKAWLDHRKMARITRLLDRPAASYLDVGCGDGRFLRAMERRGIERGRLFGLELDSRVAETLRAAGYQVECARVEDASFQLEGKLDLITMFHVIEHVADPVATVAQLAKWLAPGGILAIETPNRRSLDARLFRRTYWGGYHFPRHWHLFTTEGMVRLVARAGLEVVATTYQTGHSFWLYSVHHRLRYGTPRMPRLAKRFDPIGAFVPLVAATAWDKFRAALGFRTSAVLVAGRKPSAPVGMGVAR